VGAARSWWPLAVPSLLPAERLNTTTHDAPSRPAVRATAGPQTPSHSAGSSRASQRALEAVARQLTSSPACQLASAVPSRWPLACSPRRRLLHSAPGLVTGDGKAECGPIDFPATAECVDGTAGHWHRLSNLNRRGSQGPAVRPSALHCKIARPPSVVLLLLSYPVLSSRLCMLGSTKSLPRLPVLPPRARCRPISFSSSKLDTRSASSTTSISPSSPSSRLIAPNTARRHCCRSRF
jgi:hypothetical protein